MRRIPPHWYGILLALAIYGTVLAIFFGFLYWAAEADAKAPTKRQRQLVERAVFGPLMNLDCNSKQVCRVTTENAQAKCRLVLRLGKRYARVTFYDCVIKEPPPPTYRPRDEDIQFGEPEVVHAT